MKNGQFAIVVQQHGKRPNSVVVGSGANVASALRVLKINPETNRQKLTLNEKPLTDLTTRLKTNDLLAILPDVAGGVR